MAGTGAAPLMPDTAGVLVGAVVAAVAGA